MLLNRVDIKTVIGLVLLGGVSMVLYRAGLSASGVGGIRFFMTVAFVQSALYLLERAGHILRDPLPFCDARAGGSHP